MLELTGSLNNELRAPKIVYLSVKIAFYRCQNSVQWRLYNNLYEEYCMGTSRTYNDILHTKTLVGIDVMRLYRIFSWGFSVKTVCKPEDNHFLVIMDKDGAKMDKYYQILLTPVNKNEKS